MFWVSDCVGRNLPSGDRCCWTLVDFWDIPSGTSGGLKSQPFIIKEAAFPKTEVPHFMVIDDNVNVYYVLNTTHRNARLLWLAGVIIVLPVQNIFLFD